MSEETKQQIANVFDGINRFRLMIWKAINGCAIVALGGIIAGLANMNWHEMDGQSKFLFVCGVLLSVLKSLDMLLDQTLTKIPPK